MRTTAAIAVGLLLGLAPPASGQYDLVPDLDDPRTPAEARRWLDAALRDLESGRTVLVETPGGPLPYVVLDRSDLTRARESASLTDASRREILLWSANVLREQRALRERLASARERAFADGAATPTGPPPSRPPTPRLAVIGGTPASRADPGRPEGSDENEAASARTTLVEERPTGTERGPVPADPTATDPTATDPTMTDPTATDPTATDPTATPTDPGSPAGTTPPAVASTPVTGGSVGGGVRGGRPSGAGVWALVGLALLTVALGGALLVARRRPDRSTPQGGAAAPTTAPRIDLTLHVSGPSADRTVGFRSAPIVVGRAPDVDLALDDPRASRRHARIVVDGGALWIEDLGSTGGMEVDGRRTDRAPLRRSTTIRLGDTTMTVR